MIKRIIAGLTTVGVIWGDLATWVAAVGTVGAVVVALWLASRDSRERARGERRRQAETVTAWISGGYSLVAGENRFVAPVAVQNGSSQLVYRFIASLVQDLRGQESSPQPGLKWRVFVGELPPGRSQFTIEHPGGGMHFRAGIELAFQDAAGRWWVRKGNGRLDEIREDPAAHYGLGEPLPWSYPSAETPAAASGEGEARPKSRRRLMWRPR
jgi:hypothetical protein